MDVEGLTSFWTLAQKGSRNQLEGNDRRGTAAAIGGAEGAAEGGDGGDSTAGFWGFMGVSNLPV